MLLSFIRSFCGILLLFKINQKVWTRFLALFIICRSNCRRYNSYKFEVRGFFWVNASEYKSHNLNMFLELSVDKLFQEKIFFYKNRTAITTIGS